MENYLLLAIYLFGLIGLLTVAGAIGEAIIKYRERKYHNRVMAKVLTLK